MKLLNIALTLLMISFLLSMVIIGWTLTDPYLYDIFWEFNLISLMATILSIISFFIGIGWGLLIAHWLKKKRKI